MEAGTTISEQTVVLQDEGLRKLKGFVQIPRFILLHSALSFGAKCVYGILLSYAWQDDFCFPAQKALAKDTNCSIRQIQRLLKELKEARLLKWKQQGLNKPNIYYLLPLTDGMLMKNPDTTDLSPPEATPMSPQDTTPASPKEESLKEDSSNNSVNVTGNVDNFEPLDFSNAANAIKKFQTNAELAKGDGVDFLVMDIMDLCQDAHSKGFYRRVAQRCPASMIREALSEVKDLKLTHQLKKTAGAAFNKIIQEKAKRGGVVLDLKKP